MTSAVANPITAIMWSPGAVQGKDLPISNPLRFAKIVDSTVQVAALDIANDKPGQPLSWKTASVSDPRVSSFVADMQRAIDALQTTPLAAPKEAWTGVAPGAGFVRGADRPMYVDAEAPVALLDARTAAASIFDALNPGRTPDRPISS